MALCDVYVCAENGISVKQSNGVIVSTGSYRPSLLRAYSATTLNEQPPPSHLVCVAWRLIVVREGDNRGAHAQNHRWMDLSVRVPAQLQQVRVHLNCVLLDYLTIVHAQD